MVGGGLNALMRYGKSEELLKSFQQINNDVIECINLIRKEEKFTKSGYYRYNLLAVFYWENKLHSQYQDHQEMFDIINNILQKVNIYVTFTDEKRNKNINFGSVWEDGKSQFFCSKCNNEIKYNTLIKNIKKYNNCECGCGKCSLKSNKINKFQIDTNQIVEL